jgi:hypothetical protein
MEKPDTGSPRAWLSGARACLEPGYVEEDLVRGVWLPSRLPLEGTGPIQIVGP